MYNFEVNFVSPIYHTFWSLIIRVYLLKPTVFFYFETIGMTKLLMLPILSILKESQGR